MKMLLGRSTSARVSIFLCLITSLALGLSARSASAQVTYADSIADWSTSGTQGENGWFNGFYNLTGDGDGAYGIGDFQPFLNDGTGSVGPDGLNHWNGGGYNLDRSSGGGPWTNLGSEAAHPNGTNSTFGSDGVTQQEHWVVRRWISDVNANVSLFNNLRAQNTNGPGTTTMLFVNGAEVSRLSNPSGTAQSVRTIMPISIGDVIDLALSPEDASGDRGDGSDGSFFSLLIDDSVPPPPLPTPIADSKTDWSGVQGQGGWFNGYYNLTGDGDSTYQVTDFQPFLNDGSNVPETNPVEVNHWNGTGYDFEGNPPWTALDNEFTHPNGTNNTNEHWTIRRWAANVTSTTPLALEWNSRAQNGGGTGTTGILMINGVEVTRGTTNQTGPGLKESPSDPEPAGAGGVFYANINPGDIIELALSPEGAGGDRADGADGTFNRLRIIDELPAGPLFNPPTPGVKIADSVADFSSTGTQGENNWFYGYYDQRDDVENGDGAYGIADLTPFLNDGSGAVSTDPAIGGWKNSPNHWNGSKFDLLDQGAAGANHGPWTELSAAGGHPAANAQGDPSVHWFIRRWINTATTGDLEISVDELLSNASGDGTIGRIFQNGVEVWSELTFGNNVTDTLLLSTAPGDVFDFAVDPDGAGVFDGSLASVDLINDGSDATNFRVTISTPSTSNPFVPVPEPATGLLAALALGLFGCIRSRRIR